MSLRYAINEGRESRGGEIRAARNTARAADGRRTAYEILRRGSPWVWWRRWVWFPALEAADKMLKAADVELVSYENVGSTLVTVMVKGDVAAVRSSVEAGAAAAAAIGKADGQERDAQANPRAWAILSRFTTLTPERAWTPERAQVSHTAGRL